MRVAGDEQPAVRLLANVRSLAGRSVDSSSGSATSATESTRSKIREPPALDGFRQEQGIGTHAMPA